MADEALVAKDGQFRLVSLLPDVCLTPSKKGKPVPYMITHTLATSEQCSPNVYARGQPVFLHNLSYADHVRGDEPGKGGGVVTRVNMRVSHSIGHSASVFANGRPIVRTADTVWMNQRRP